MSDVFISYAHADAPTAKNLADRLAKRGFRVFRDVDTLVSGEGLADQIAAAVARSAIVLVLLSRNSKRSTWVEHELARALENGKTVIPILLDSEAKDNWVWPLIADRQALELKSDSELDAVVQTILDTQEPGAPTPPRNRRWIAPLAVAGLVALIMIATKMLPVPRVQPDPSASASARLALEARNEMVTNAQKFVTGQRDSVVFASSTDIANQLHPVVRYEYANWRYVFSLAMTMPADVQKHVKRVRYQLDPAFYDPAPLDGRGENYESKVVVTACRSKVNASVELDDSAEATVSFDWCKLSGWIERVRYDTARLGQLDIFPSNCREAKAILQLIPENLLSKVGTLQIVRQLYSADSRWQPSRGVPLIQFAGLRSARDPKQIAIVASCSRPETCVDLAAASYALLGGMPPELHCGKIPKNLVTEEVVDIPQLPNASLAEPELRPKSPRESCFRLSACDVVTAGYPTQYPISFCTAGDVSRDLLACARQATCKDVMSCTSKAASSP